MSLRLIGLILFLPVPIVLILFTRLPLGVWPSLAVGVVLMVTHRLYARPFARRHASARCLWCGRPLDGGPTLRVLEPFGETDWKTCDAAHGDNVRRVLGWAWRRAVLLKAGILGGLALLLIGLSIAPLAPAGAPRPDDWIALFRAAVALSVLPLGWLAPRAEPSRADPLPSPFPVHIQALIGTASVVWLFRGIGILWLALALAHGAERLRFASLRRAPSDASAKRTVDKSEEGSARRAEDASAKRTVDKSEEGSARRAEDASAKRTVDKSEEGSARRAEDASAKRTVDKSEEGSARRAEDASAKRTVDKSEEGSARRAEDASAKRTVDKGEQGFARRAEDASAKRTVDKSEEGSARRAEDASAKRTVDKGEQGFARRAEDARP